MPRDYATRYSFRYSEHTAALVNSRLSILCAFGAHFGMLEARVGFEPTNGGFADLSLGPLGYRAGFFSIPNLNSEPAMREGCG